MSGRRLKRRAVFRIVRRSMASFLLTQLFPTTCSHEAYTVLIELAIVQLTVLSETDLLEKPPVTRDTSPRHLFRRKFPSGACHTTVM